MPELRISDIPAVAGGIGRRVEVTWQDGRTRRMAVTAVGETKESRDGELLRWYLEDYAEFPADPAPALAASAEQLLAREGTELFKRVFSSPDAVGIWDRARDRLTETRIEVDADPGNGPGLAWELLRDPARDAPLALGAGAFVRTHRQAAGHPDLPEPSGDRLRVLLVICRPGGRDDVPFRSVASRLVRGGADQMAGLDLDVLRPATFARLSAVLRSAKANGRPYHVVHFDGHGTYLDVTDLDLGPDDTRNQAASDGGIGDLSPLRYGISVAGPVRPGQHGYLLFEAPAGGSVTGGAEHVQLVDGPTLGRLLTETGVPVLVLNACRSAYAEARAQPTGDAPGESGGGGDPTRTRDPADDDDLPGADGLAADVHARIRAYGSLAAEVADAGVPGVVAMRYNVYVVTAAQFVADLYAHLLSGRSLGEAATEARRALAADPARQIGAVPVALQDWAVPLVYESVPLALLRPRNHAAPVIRLAPADARPATADRRPGDASATGDGQGHLMGLGPDGLPRQPDAGFFGRDETLLALDRAFDSQQVVLLHAYAGAGKSATAAEFARWYQATGGLDHPTHHDWPAGPVLWSSFEHRLTADRVIGQAGDHFAPLIDQSYKKAWAAVTDPAERRAIVLQVLAQIPVLWIWDNVEPVTGFPAGLPSAWTKAEQDELADFLRDLAQQTACRVLLTSRRDERSWLGNLPGRVQLLPMPMRESLQLAAALAARHGRVGRSVAAADWRPLLRFAAGNPLTITVVTGQALREDLRSSGELAAFVARLRAGEVPAEAAGDAALGRSRSLAASLDYGFAHAFNATERSRLAVLHLFRDTVDVYALRSMGDPEKVGEDAVPELAGLDPGALTALLDRASEIGLLLPLGGGYYAIHPALPWYFTALFTVTYGLAADGAARRAARAHVQTFGRLGDYYFGLAESGQLGEIIGALRAEESNLLHALDRGRAAGLWDAAIGCMQALELLYTRTGRDGEWNRLVTRITADVTDLTTESPLPGHDDNWAIVTHYRAQLAVRERDFSAAAALQEGLVKRHREWAAAALADPATTLPPGHNRAIRNLSVALGNLADILLMQRDPRCLAFYQEALALARRTGNRLWEAHRASSLGNAYLHVPELRDLDEAERWFRHGLDLQVESDHLGRATKIASLGQVAMNRFDQALASGQAERLLLGHLNEALRRYQESLGLTAADDHGSRAQLERLIGNVYRSAGDVGRALPFYQRSIQHSQVRGDTYHAGNTRLQVALLLRDDGRIGEALEYARAALANFSQLGLGAVAEARAAESLIAALEQRASQRDG